MPERQPRPPSLLAQPSYLASQVSKYGRRQLEVALARHDLQLAHDAILSALDDFGALSQQQLADALDLDKSRIVGWVDDLTGRHLVTRSQDPADRRRNVVALTDRGRRLVKKLGPIASQSQCGFLGALSPAEQRTLGTLLRRVLEANDARSLGPRTGPRQNRRRTRQHGSSAC